MVPLVLLISLAMLTEAAVTLVSLASTTISTYNCFYVDVTFDDSPSSCTLTYSGSGSLVGTLTSSSNPTSVYTFSNLYIDKAETGTITANCGGSALASSSLTINVGTLKVDVSGLLSVIFT